MGLTAPPDQPPRRLPRPPWPRRGDAAAGRRRPPRPRTLLLLAAVAVLVVYAGLTPWALHIGGRFTPLRQWDGYGAVRASNGGHYVLSVHFSAGFLGSSSRHGGCDGFGGCDTLHGNAKLCTKNGRTYSLGLTGAVHSWWSTDGARTSVDLTGKQLPDGWVVAFSGRWHGPVLPLADTDNSFTEVFTPAGAVRHITSTADAGTAVVTLSNGGGDAFTRACHALAARRA